MKVFVGDIGVRSHIHTLSNDIFATMPLSFIFLLPSGLPTAFVKLPAS